MRTPQRPINSGHSAATTARDIIAGIDLTGKTVIVTGGSAGLGLETTRQLASAGANVVVPARSPEKARTALVGVANVEIEELELTRPQSVAQFAERFLRSNRPLPILINSAGVMATPLDRDELGNESQLAANYLGHFQLVRHLWPALASAEGSRVVSLSSRGHFYSGVDFDDPNFEHRDYDPMIAYAQAKSACALLAVAIDDHGKADGIRAFSVHPGGVITGLSTHFSEEMFRQFGVIDDNGDPVIDPANDKKTPEQGAATQLWCAVSPQLKGMGGVYCEDCDIALPSPADSEVRRGVKPWACDPDIAARLWAMSEDLVSSATDRHKGALPMPIGKGWRTAGTAVRDYR